MTRELENRLAEEFEFMRRGSAWEGGIIAHLYNAFGIEAEDGWYQLIYDLCKEISEVLTTAEEPVQLMVDQIKEKYGTLRFYFHLEGTDSKSEVYQKILDIVEKYEDMSEKVCELCGREGSLRDNLDYIQTLCDTCYFLKIH